MSETPPHGLHLYNAVLANDWSGHRIDPWPPKVKDEPIKWLTSFHYYRNADYDKIVDGITPAPMIFADSGAFSAHTQGASVSVTEYAEWLLRWKHHFAVYVTLDVIRDPEATAENQHILEDMGLAPIPVFHTGSPFEVLDGLAERYPYVALGGMVGVPGPVAMKWAAECFRRTKHTGVQFHGFGQTRRDVMGNLPWYSVDSSSWGKGHRFGTVETWVGNRLVNVPVGKQIRDSATRAAIREAGIDPRNIEDRSRYHRSHAIRVSSYGWRCYEHALRARWGPINLRDTHTHRSEPVPGGYRLDKPGLHLHQTWSPPTSRRRRKPPPRPHSGPPNQVIRVIVACGRHKAPATCRADRLYRGGYHQMCLRWALSVSDNPLILSAKYGFLECSDVVRPYDLKMGGPGSITVEALTDQARSRDYPDHVVFVGGIKYLTVLRDVFVRVDAPFSGLPDGRFGFQMQAMKQSIGRIP